MNDILTIFRAIQPKLVYTRNLADKHDTSADVTFRVIPTIRKLDNDEGPKRLVVCEVWHA